MSVDAGWLPSVKADLPAIRYSKAMPMSEFPQDAAEFIAAYEAGTLSPGKTATPVERLRDHLIASRDKRVAKAAREFEASRLDADGLLAIGTLTQAIDGIDKSLG
jgi:hypothetical protein